MNDLITCQNLCFSYDSQKVLDNVSFIIKEKEYIGIIGPNGGGKTTLLKLLLGFLKPTFGTLTILGKTPQEMQAKIGYVPQNLSYDKCFPISTLEVVLGGLLSQLPWYGFFSKQHLILAEEMLEKVGLLSLKKKAFGELSGGQQQRTLIARALAAKPALLLLDEPTASVDSQAEEEILNLLNDLKNAVTILLVTHDLQTAIDQVKRVLCVQQTVYTYTPAEVCDHYRIGLYHPPLKQSLKGF